MWNWCGLSFRYSYWTVCIKAHSFAQDLMGHCMRHLWVPGSLTDEIGRSLNAWRICGFVRPGQAHYHAHRQTVNTACRQKLVTPHTGGFITRCITFFAPLTATSALCWEDAIFFQRNHIMKLFEFCSWWCKLYSSTVTVFPRWRYEIGMRWQGNAIILNTFLYPLQQKSNYCTHT